MRTPAQTGARAAALDLLVFELEAQRYALLAEDVLEVQRAVALARLPRAPGIVEGVFDLRGRLVPVLDARRRFGLPPRALAASDHLLIARALGRAVALRVDRALDIASVPASAIEDARPAVPGVEHVAGVARLADGLVLIHDLRSFLSLEEGRALDAALGGAEAPA